MIKRIQGGQCRKCLNGGNVVCLWKGGNVGRGPVGGANDVVSFISCKYRKCCSIPPVEYILPLQGKAPMNGITRPDHSYCMIISCFTGLDSVPVVTLKVTTDLLVWLNRNQSNRRSAVHWYFPVHTCPDKFADGYLHFIKIASCRNFLWTSKKLWAS